MVIRQYEIHWIDLDPTRGAEMKKTRPCAILSPNEMNIHLNTVLIAPITSTGKDWPTRISIEMDGRPGWLVLDQIRCVDRERLVKKTGRLQPKTVQAVKRVLREMLVD